jgi:hypothetical protein
VRSYLKSKPGVVVCICNPRYEEAEVEESLEEIFSKKQQAKRAGLSGRAIPVPPVNK